MTDAPISREAARSRRKREVRGHTISSVRTPKRELKLMRMRADIDLQAAGDFFSPTTRGDCEFVVRPCPHVSCKFNLYLDVSPQTGSVKLNFPDLEPEELPADASCTLDVADHGGSTLERVAEVMNMTRERVRQIEVTALAKVAPGLRAHADFGVENEGGGGPSLPSGVDDADTGISDLFDVWFEAAMARGTGGEPCP